MNDICLNYVIKIKGASNASKALFSKGIDTTTGYVKMYSEDKYDIDFRNSLLYLPVYPSLPLELANKIAQIVKSSFAHENFS